MDYSRTGNLLLQAGRYTEALESYSHALLENPHNPSLYSNRSGCYLLLEEYELSLQDGRRCIELDHTLAMGYYRAGCALYWLHRYTEALEVVEKGLKGTPAICFSDLELRRLEELRCVIAADMTAAVLAGNVLLNDGQYTEALDKYSEAISCEPDNAILYCNRSGCYLLLEEYELSLQDGRRCLELNNTFAMGYYRVGCALYWLHRYTEALEVVDDGIRTDPSDLNLRRLVELKGMLSSLLGISSGVSEGKPSHCPLSSSSGDDLFHLSHHSNPGPLGAYTVYRIYRGNKSMAERRYREFLQIRDILQCDYPGALVPPLPGKRVVGVLQEKFVLCRERYLKEFINRVAVHPELRTADCFRVFVEGGVLTHPRDATKQHDKKPRKYPVPWLAALKASIGLALEQDNLNVEKDDTVREVKEFLSDVPMQTAEVGRTASCLQKQYENVSISLISLSGSVCKLGLLGGGRFQILCNMYSTALAALARANDTLSHDMLVSVTERLQLQSAVLNSLSLALRTQQQLYSESLRYKRLLESKTKRGEHAADGHCKDSIQAQADALSVLSANAEVKFNVATTRLLRDFQSHILDRQCIIATTSLVIADLQLTSLNEKTSVLLKLKMELESL